MLGYQLPPAGVPAPPPRGQAWADRRLEAFGVRQGDTLRLGPQRTPIKVRGWVEDTNYLLQGSLWVSPATWRSVQNANRPDARFPPGTFPVLVVDGDGDASALARRIDAATGGATETLTKDEAVLASPGTRQQKSTFNGIIGVTFLVAGLVAALFFALLTLERAPIYGVLKALGTTTRRLVAGVLLQAVVIATVAFVAGGAGHVRACVRSSRRGSRSSSRARAPSRRSWGSCSPPRSAAPSRSAGSPASTP